MEGGLCFARWGAGTGNSGRTSRDLGGRGGRKRDFRGSEGDRLDGARGHRKRACIAVQNAARADMMAGMVRAVLGRRFGWLLREVAAQAQCVQAQEFGEL